MRSCSCATRSGSRAAARFGAGGKAGRVVVVVARGVRRSAANDGTASTATTMSASGARGMRRGEHGQVALSPVASRLRVAGRRMPTLALILEPSTTPSASRSIDRALLARATVEGRGTLRVSRFAGDVLGLGRWHLAPRGAPGVELHRRLSGGRATATGAGFVHVSLTLPHRSALVSGDPLALAPEQVLNRAVRGVLGGLEAGGLPALYPGRDLLTVAGRPLAVLGF